MTSHALNPILIMKERMSNIEFLRIVSMLMVLNVHTFNILPPPIIILKI